MIPSAERYATCVTQRAVSSVSWPFVRASCGQKRTRTLASDAVRAIKRARATCSAPALITARRRSYFTRRSSIIHAVNNAPLFRVTLYREKGEEEVSPSFLPSLPISYILQERGERGGGGELRVFPGERPPPARTRSEVRIRSRHSYLQVYPPKRRHASVWPLARRAWLAFYSTSSREGFLQDSRNERRVTSGPSFRLIDPTFALLIFTYFFNVEFYSHLNK